MKLFISWNPFTKVHTLHHAIPINTAVYSPDFHRKLLSNTQTPFPTSGWRDCMRKFVIWLVEQDANFEIYWYEMTSIYEVVLDDDQLAMQFKLTLF